jgi:hypothetical protein
VTGVQTCALPIYKYKFLLEVDIKYFTLKELNSILKIIVPEILSRRIKKDAYNIILSYYRQVSYFDAMDKRFGET